MLKLAEYVLHNLRVEVAAADTYIRLDGDLCVEMILGEILGIAPDGPFSDDECDCREFSEGQRAYARKCLGELGMFMRSRVKVAV